MADRYGDEFHPSPVLLEGRDEGKVFLGLLLVALVASKVPAESDLDGNEVALLAVEGFRVRPWAVRYSSDVNEVGGCSVPCFVEGVLDLVGEDPGRDAGWRIRALRVGVRIGVVSWVL